MIKLAKVAKMTKMANNAKITKMASEHLGPKWPERQQDQKYGNDDDCRKNQQVENGKNEEMTRKTNSQSGQTIKIAKFVKLAEMA